MTEAEPIVFVVDDDPSVRRSMERLIQSTGFKIQTFRSAGEFLRRPRPEGPACLVLDVRLPGLSGLDLQRELTNSGIQLPIIFMTAHGDIPMTVRAMKGGAMEFLTKPFRTRRLLDAIRAAIERDRDTLKQRTEVAELVTSERTIKFHRAHIMQKMRAESLADLVRMAQKLGLTSQA